MNKTRKILIALIALLAVFAFSSCSEFEGDKGTDTQKNDKKASEDSLKKQQKSQPTPVFEYSQLRQNLIEIVTAQAESTQTTTFFFLEGVGLVGSCPSIGFPIASTAQITNPEVKGGGTGDEGYFTLPQVEPTGVYTGDSTGTYVICISGDGDAYANYFEGYVQTVTGPATFRDGEVVLTGTPTADFSEGK